MSMARVCALLFVRITAGTGIDAVDQAMADAAVTCELTAMTFAAERTYSK